MPRGPRSEEETTPQWFAYVLASADDRRTYVGITTDLERRLCQHNGELPGGARSTRAGRPWSLAVRLGPYPDRSYATRVERALKRRPRRRRLTVTADELDAELA